MTKKSDISVPNGYFEGLQARLQAIPSKEMQPGVLRKVSPWLAYAASLAILVSVGSLVLGPSRASTQDEGSWDYVSYLSRSLDPDGVVELRETEELSREDIVNFLLADNVSVEQLLYSSYEEDY